MSIAASILEPLRRHMLTITAMLYRRELLLALARCETVADWESSRFGRTESKSQVSKCASRFPTWQSNTRPSQEMAFTPCGSSGWARFDAETGKPLAGDKWPEQGDQQSLAFTSDGRLLFGFYSRGLSLWNPTTGTVSFVLPEVSGRV